MKKIRKAVIPVAGLGVRFLPATKTIPKELLPIVDKPNLMLIVEEALEAGIEDLVFISGRNKEAIEDFFDISVEIERKLQETGKTQILEDLNYIRNHANFISIRQKQALGLGHAIYCSKPVVGNEDFAVLLGDELFHGKPRALSELNQVYQQKQLSTVAMLSVPKEEVSKYGIISGKMGADGLFAIDDVIEKPNANEAPSNFALPGRYIFTNKIFSYLEKAKPGKNGEIQLTDSMALLARDEGMIGVQCKSKRYDAGDKLGFLIANVEMALEHPEIGPAFRKYLKDFAKGL